MVFLSSDFGFVSCFGFFFLLAFVVGGFCCVFGAVPGFAEISVAGASGWFLSIGHFARCDGLVVWFEGVQGSRKLKSVSNLTRDSGTFRVFLGNISSLRDVRLRNKIDW